ncbi:PIG-L deacetylase family protein [Staphylococcus chromogenes]|nr:PIG-L deacetylase family protein [Staphylococcus chromogenes]
MIPNGDLLRRHARDPKTTNWAPFIESRQWPEVEPNGLFVVAAHPDDELLGLGATMHRMVKSGKSVRVLCLSCGDDPIRSQEFHAGLEDLGVTDRHIADLPDGDLLSHLDAAEELIRDLHDGRTLATTWAEDGHPDHLAAARASARVDTPRYFPIWMWQWAVPGDDVFASISKLSVGETDLAAKLRALECHASQLGRIVPKSLVNTLEHEWLL